MLKFLLAHSTHLVRNHQKVLFECSKTSFIWTKSPLQCLKHYPQLDSHLTDMCRFSPQPDGQRHRRETRLVTNMTLKESLSTCKCHRGHMQLQGLEDSTYQRRSLLTSMYPKKFCLELCADIIAQIDKLSRKTKALGGQMTEEAPQHPHLQGIPSTTRVSHTSAFPAETDDQDDDLPDTLPPVNPPSSVDPLKQLRDLNTDTLKIDDTSISQITDILDKQLLKASILT